MAYGNLPISAADLRALSEEELDEALSQLTPKQAEEILYTWELWARPNQLEPVQLRDGEKDFFLYVAGRGSGKDTKNSTPILTHNRGWTTIGEIEIGDYVYAWDGTPTKVIDTYSPPKRALVEFTFSDGATLTTSVEHEWVTWTHRDRKQYNRKDRDSVIPYNWPNWKESVNNVGQKDYKPFVGPEVRTTQEIIDTFTHSSRNDLNHSIPMCKPIEGKHNEEIEDPYYLGYWLGDGFSASLHSLACGKEDEWWIYKNWPEFKEVGPCVYRGVAGSKNFLKRLGLYKNKHFPEEAILASVEQRLAILQGMMDSDGYAGGNSVEFMSTNRSLADGVLYLARSLGQKPVLSEGRATLDGKDCGPKYRVTWRPAYGINPFRLPRKAEKVTFGGSQEMRNHHRMIVDYKFVEWEPTTCISVEHPDHLFLAGEALIPTHNTRAGAEWVRHRIKSGDKIINCVAPTNSDIRRVMVEGESGLLNVCWKNDKTYRGGKMGYPEWSPTNRTLTWENGAKALFFSAEDPERLRGPQAEAAWCDEVAAWRNMRETWDMLMFGLRLGKHPKTMVTTTPKPVRLLRELLASDRSVISRGSTYDNLDNLAPSFIKGMKETYEGTRLGRQELYAEVLEEAAGALWSSELLDKAALQPNEVPTKDQLERIVVSVDPAVTSNEESDMTGIVVAGIDVNGIGYVLEDATEQLSPSGWAKKVIELYYKYQADRIVAERNQGGDMVRYTIETEDPTVPIRLVSASKGKKARAEPVSALYEQGKVKHAPGLDALEQQMVTWEPLGSVGSPDRLDSLVWGLTELMLGGISRPQISIGYQSEKDIKESA